MKKKIVLILGLMFSLTLFAQNEQREGDDLVAAGNFEDAAAMYRICMENDEGCLLKLFRLIFDEKVEPKSLQEPYQLISPLAQKGVAEAQYYLGVMYRNGVLGVQKDELEAAKWTLLSFEQNYIHTRSEITEAVDLSDIYRINEISEINEVIQSDILDINDVTDALPTETPNSKRPVELKLSKTTMSSPGLPTVLFVGGGVAIVAGAAATYLLPPTVREDWSNAQNTGSYQIIKKQRPAFLIAGSVVGAACIGAGFYLKMKGSSQSSDVAFESDHSMSRPNRDRYVYLHVITDGYGAGFRLTF